MLTTQRVCQEWSLDEIFDDGQWCPICQGAKFTHIEGQGIFCDHCNASFTLRMPGGDDGVVIDCKADPHGRYAFVGRPQVKGKENPYYFWQVLKPCNEGLHDRTHWLSGIGSDMESYYYSRERATKAPRFARLCTYSTHKAAEQQLWENWIKTPTYQKLKEREAACADGDYAEKDRVWGDMNQASAKYRLKNEAAVGQKLEALGLPEGLYFEHQCEKIFDDSFWVHRCIPKAGEKPVLADWPIYKA